MGNSSTDPRILNVGNNALNSLKSSHTLPTLFAQSTRLYSPAL